ncbi:NADPH:quinone reductase [Micromonospora arborensis]|uniref:NADPH:quinone reductase n=1 Tax=Micromonospora arborensis TaxID=2116518 RepID=A0A318NTU8_9ACTN|nr:zinc-binding dehydrogenase [Micromonospora arborensis]PYC63886.1 NADPH:quinone reductase [Micromonospora arborensis]
MRAILFDRYGDPDVLIETELPVPEPGPGQISLDVTCAGVNFAEVMFRRGQIQVGLPHVPGLEATGTVRAVGEGVIGLRPGQPISALTLDGGGYAEVALARADLTVALEGSRAVADPALAAAFPCNVPVAQGLLESAARLLPGESVLVLAAAGGVGTAAAQIARLAGASLVLGATGTTAKATYAAAFGYDEVVPYEALADLVAERTDGRGVDVILDSVGGEQRTKAAGMLAPLGRQLIFGDAAQQDEPVQPNHFWFGSRAMVGYNIGDLAHRAPKLVQRHLERAAELVAAGDVRVEVTEFDLADAAEAHRTLADRSSTGKLVLRVNG